MKRFGSPICLPDFLASTRRRSSASLIAVLLCCPILVTIGCDMGTYNKRLTEPVNSSPAEEAAPAVTEAADNNEDKSADETSGRGQR